MEFFLYLYTIFAQRPRSKAAGIAQIPSGILENRCRFANFASDLEAYLKSAALLLSSKISPWLTPRTSSSAQHFFPQAAVFHPRGPHGRLRSWMIRRPSSVNKGSM
jgi:hypothetical protein